MLINYAPLFSQISQSNFTLSEYNRIKARDFNLNAERASINGSPYEHDDFRPAVIKNLKGDSASVAIRYNVFQDEMEYLNGKDAFWLDKLNTKSVTFANKTVYIPLAYQDGNKVVKSYFILLASGKYTLLKKIRIDYKEAVPASGYIEPKPNRFERENDEFYLKSGEEAPVLIRNKKDIEEAFPPLKDALAKIKVRFSKENELIEMVNKINGTTN